MQKMLWVFCSCLAVLVSATKTGKENNTNAEEENPLRVFLLQDAELRAILPGDLMAMSWEDMRATDYVNISFVPIENKKSHGTLAGLFRTSRHPALVTVPNLPSGRYIVRAWCGIHHTLEEDGRGVAESSEFYVSNDGQFVGRSGDSQDYLEGFGGNLHTDPSQRVVEIITPTTIHCQAEAYAQRAPRGERIEVKWVYIQDRYKYGELNVFVLEKTEDGLKIAANLGKVARTADPTVFWDIPADLPRNRDYMIYVGMEGTPETTFSKEGQSNDKGTVGGKFYLRNPAEMIAHYHHYPYYYVAPCHHKYKGKEKPTLYTGKATKKTKEEVTVRLVESEEERLRLEKAAKEEEEDEEEADKEMDSETTVKKNSATRYGLMIAPLLVMLSLAFM